LSAPHTTTVLALSLPRPYFLASRACPDGWHQQQHPQHRPHAPGFSGSTRQCAIPSIHTASCHGSQVLCNRARVVDERSYNRRRAQEVKSAVSKHPSAQSPWIPHTQRARQQASPGDLRLLCALPDQKAADCKSFWSDFPLVVQQSTTNANMTPGSDYKAEKKASVTDLQGGGIWEINILTLMAPVCPPASPHH
jgi:hypothetical protein